MNPPYESSEVAQALLARSRSSQPGWILLDVRADMPTRCWVVRIRDSARGAQRRVFPFASARGIYTPAEIAAHVAEGGWPFG